MSHSSELEISSWNSGYHLGIHNNCCDPLKDNHFINPKGKNKSPC